MRPARAIALLVAPLLVALLTACGARGPLDRVAGLDDATRAALVAFDTRLAPDHLPAMLPPSAQQTVDLRPASAVASGLLRYLPLLAPELGAAFDEFEQRTGTPPLEAFDRLLFWSDAPTVAEMNAAGREAGLLVAASGPALAAMLQSLESETLAVTDPGPDPAPDDPPTAGEAFDVRLTLAAFATFDETERATLDRLIAEDTQRVETVPIGPHSALSTLRGVDESGPWTMYLFIWPGGLLAEREVRADLTDLRTALERLRRMQHRVEQAAALPVRALPVDRVLEARFVGETPMEIDFDVGKTVGLRLSAPVASFNLDMPPQLLVASWPHMKTVVGNGLAQALEPAGLPGGYGPLLQQAFAASELTMVDRMLVFRTVLPRSAFEQLLPTL
jgi:hypothetical protein